MPNTVNCIPNTVHYIERVFPGFICAETSTDKVEHRDPLKVDRKDRMEGFRFFDRIETEECGHKLMSEPFNHSHWYYPGGTVLDKSQVDNPTVLGNMVQNKVSHVVRTAGGSIYFLDEGDQVL